MNSLPPSIKQSVELHYLGKAFKAAYKDLRQEEKDSIKELNELLKRNKDNLEEFAASHPGVVFTSSIANVTAKPKLPKQNTKLDMMTSLAAALECFREMKDVNEGEFHALLQDKLQDKVGEQKSELKLCLQRKKKLHEPIEDVHLTSKTLLSTLTLFIQNGEAIVQDADLGESVLSEDEEKRKSEDEDLPPLEALPLNEEKEGVAPLDIQGERLVERQVRRAKRKQKLTLTTQKKKKVA